MHHILSNLLCVIGALKAATFCAILTTLAAPVPAQTLAPSTSPARAVDFTEACADGLVQDDGSAETGYGWVPSVVDGIYVQEVHSSQVPVPQLEKACVCWLRTRTDADIDFEVVAYAQQDGQPAPTPYASFPAHADNVPSGVTGRFYEVDVSGLTLKPGTNYIGVRWDPSADPFFFVCTDTSPATDPVEVFFIDDRAGGWTSAFQTLDSVFALHRAILVRLETRPFSVLEVPTLSHLALALFIFLLIAAAVVIGRRSSELHRD